MSSPRYRLDELVRYMLALGTTGFGGPVALVEYMRRDLVEARGWCSESEFKEGLALSQLMPGPLAAQLAIYLGFVHYGVLGATLVGVAFVLPSFFMVVALGWAYVRFDGLTWMQAIFFGVGPAVIAIIALSAYKLTTKTIGKDWLLWAIYAVSFCATVATESENLFLFLGAGLVTLVVRTARPTASASVVPGLLAVIDGGESLVDRLSRIAWFFGKAGAFVFGSGLAIVPFLYGGVVKEYAWLNDREFLDAVAVAMVTPGPVVITVGFIGFVVTARDGGFWWGLAGASVAALATFVPCWFFTVVPAPYFKRFGKRPSVVAFVDGVTAAAVGAIAGACVVLGRRTLLENGVSPDWIKVAICATTLGLLLRFKKLNEPIVIAATGVFGLIAYPLLKR